jgi:hypothetical protein
MWYQIKNNKLLIGILIIVAIIIVSEIWFNKPTPTETDSATVSETITPEPTPSPTVSEPTTTEPYGPPPSPETLTPNDWDALLSQLTIAEETNADSYDRELFRHWTDADSDSCDTRKEILIIETLTPVIQETNCKIVSGQWYSPYDNQTLTDPSGLDIDHMVPLKEAWRSGAHSWDSSRREAFANDIQWEYSLIAVTAGSNRSKSDQDPSDWMPTNTTYTCDYLYQWVSVKIRWQLTIDTDEHNTIRSIITNTCEKYSIPPNSIPAG